MKKIEIFTDGACLGNPGDGGWAFIAKIGKQLIEKSGYLPNTTNNRAEFTAAIEALKFAKNHKGNVIIHTDSELLYNTMTKWIKNWQKNNWKKSDGKPVQNLDLIQELNELSNHQKVEWIKVPAHSGMEMNERCDKLAKNAALNKNMIKDENNNLSTMENLFFTKHKLESNEGDYFLEIEKDNDIHLILYKKNKKIAKFTMNKKIISDLLE